MSYGYGGGPPPYAGYAPPRYSGGSGLPAGCGCFLFLVLLCPGLYLLGPALSVIAMYFLGLSLYRYIALLGAIMGVWGGKTRAGPAPIPAPPDVGSGRTEPAFTHYLFGPAMIDLRHSIRVALPAPLRVAGQYGETFQRTFHGRDPAWILLPIGIVLRLGMYLGVGLGFVFVGLLWLLQLTVVAALALVVIAAAMGLRAVDSGMRRIKGIRTSCPSCHLHVSYPSYGCSGPHCDRRHRDIRPGRYGVIKRRCACGTLLPTLLLTGSGDGRMTAYCPHCQEPMSTGSGAMPEIVIPVLGATAAGKTRLMTALVMGLLDGHGGHGAEAEFADAQSETAYREPANKLRAGVHTWKTVKAKDAPLRAYSLHLKPAGGARRLFHIFDAPGELVAKSESMRELRYIRSARTFVFTLDLLSVDAVWQSLEPAARSKHQALRSDVAPDFVFGQIVQNIEAHGVRMGRARLAVALTKDDLVRDCPSLAGVGDGSEDIGRWLAEAAGLDGMIRAMRRSFAEVRFFRTSSWLDGDELDDGVLDLTRWILEREGLRVRRTV